MRLMSDDPHEVQVWHAAAANDQPGPVEVYCEQQLLEDERIAADRFRVASARHQHVVGRGMARVLLSSGCCGAHEIGFRLLDHGKPIVEQPLPARRAFNVAHTKGLVLCGIGPGKRSRMSPWIGVDVEWDDRRTDPALAHRYFAPVEIQQLEATSSDAEHRELFLKLWTLKEAFIKAIGTGLFTPLDRFAFQDANSPEPQLTVSDPELSRGRNWRFVSFQPRPGFIAAVAMGDEMGTIEPGQSLSVGLFDFETKVVSPNL